MGWAGCDFVLWINIVKCIGGATQKLVVKDHSAPR